MVNKTNGRSIRIPVRRVAPQLPTPEDPARPLLTSRDPGQEAVSDVRPDVEDREPPEPLVEARGIAEDEIQDVGDWQERVRRRFDRWAKSQIRDERQRLLLRLLAVADNLERALAHSDRHDPLRAGVQLTLDDLLRQLAQEGVEPMQALGRTFDPTRHEAVATDGSGGDTVVEVLETGFFLNGELLRPARVIVGRSSG